LESGFLSVIGPKDATGTITAFGCSRSYAEINPGISELVAVWKKPRAMRQNTDFGAVSEEPKCPIHLTLDAGIGSAARTSRLEPSRAMVAMIVVFMGVREQRLTLKLSYRRREHRSI
jgi:hypothetical protein